MILEDGRRAICRYHATKKNSAFTGVDVGMPRYRANRREIHDRNIHLILRTDLVKHIPITNV